MESYTSASAEKKGVRRERAELVAGAERRGLFSSVTTHYNMRGKRDFSGTDEQHLASKE